MECICFRKTGQWKEEITIVQPLAKSSTAAAVIRHAFLSPAQHKRDACTYRHDAVPIWPPLLDRGRSVVRDFQLSWISSRSNIICDSALAAQAPATAWLKFDIFSFHVELIENIALAADFLIHHGSRCGLLKDRS
eukprot:5913406-Amphidinium_carterae.1